MRWRSRSAAAPGAERRSSALAGRCGSRCSSASGRCAGTGAFSFCGQPSTAAVSPQPVPTPGRSRGERVESAWTPEALDVHAARHAKLMTGKPRSPLRSPESDSRLARNLLFYLRDTGETFASTAKYLNFKGRFRSRIQMPSQYQHKIDAGIRSAFSKPRPALPERSSGTPVRPGSIGRPVAHDGEQPSPVGLQEDPADMLDGWPWFWD